MRPKQFKQNMRTLQLAPRTNPLCSLVLVFSLLFPAASSASENRAATPISTVQDSAKSELFESCKESVQSPNFETSYCADVLRNALFGFSWVTSSTPPNNWGKCDQQWKAHERSMKWLRYLPDSITLLEIAKQYVAKKSASSISLIDTPLLSNVDEQQLASVIATYKSRYGDKLNTSFEAEMSKRTASKTTYWLYESCRTLRPTTGSRDKFSGSYCEAVVSGLWIGYALAYDQIPTLLNDNKCNGKAKDISGFVDRFKGEFACSISARKSNVETAIAYLTSVEKRTPSQILRLADEPPHIEVVRQISNLCKRR